MNANRPYPKYISMMKTTDLEKNFLLDVGVSSSPLNSPKGEISEGEGSNEHYRLSLRNLCMLYFSAVKKIVHSWQPFTKRSDGTNLNN
jgi:hypothetical protein